MDKFSATYTLPEVFDPNEMGLMTVREYTDYQNPHEKYHPDESYDYTLKRMNEVYDRYKGECQYESGYRFSLWENQFGYLIKLEDEPVAVLHKETLYVLGNFRRHIPKNFFRNRDRVDLSWSRTKRVKYLTEYIPLIRTEHGKDYRGVFFQRKKLKGEMFEFWFAEAPSKNEGTRITVFNSEMQTVGFADDEWGATLITVAKEYRGYGLGSLIGSLWKKWNPNYLSGGYTSRGYKAAKIAWERRVREFLANGWYSQLVKEGRITKERVKKILDGLQGYKNTHKFHFEKHIPKDQPKKQLLIFWDDVTFILYDSRFLVDPDEKYIHGTGFFRDGARGMILYSLEYDPKYRDLTLMTAFQGAKQIGSPIYNNWDDYSGQSFEDFSGLDYVVEDNGNYELIHDVLPLRTLARKEKMVRKKLDPYEEKYHLLMEMAESKW
jgi:hypothetical protein